MRNPVLIELTRGALVESRHAGAVAVVRADGEIVAAVGDVAAPTFPRSAIKPLQAIPLVETGAADHFGFGPPEIALASASHSGTQAHTALVRSMLARAGLSPDALACGVHEPLDPATARAMIRSGAAPTALHHNCSGKHAGMLATAAHKTEPTASYWLPDHPVQMRILGTLEHMTGRRLGSDVRGIDGCSVPNWAVPLADLASAFARFVTGEGLTQARRHACQRLAEACWAEPRLVAGQDRLDSVAMGRLPGKVLIKAGAEGVYCGAFPAAGLGFALKVDDGGKRAADLVAASLLRQFCPEATDLGLVRPLHNFRGLTVGEIRAADALKRLLGRLG
jgi:L-asparaginase II